MQAIIVVMQVSNQYKGVKLASGQEIFSHQLVMEPSFTVSSSALSLLDDKVLDGSNLASMVAKGVIIANKAIQQDSSNILVLFPPRCKIHASLHCLCFLFGTYFP